VPLYVNALFKLSASTTPVISKEPPNDALAAPIEIVELDNLSTGMVPDIWASVIYPHVGTEPPPPNNTCAVLPVPRDPNVPLVLV